MKIKISEILEEFLIAIAKVLCAAVFCVLLMLAAKGV